LAGVTGSIPTIGLMKRSGSGRRVIDASVGMRGQRAPRRRWLGEHAREDHRDDRGPDHGPSRDDGSAADATVVRWMMHAYFLERFGSFLLREK